jgi:hypothetical protein
MAKERFIPSIFNYCDYWCERCPFTRRCRNFAMGQELETERKAPPDDVTNMAFWNTLAGKLNEASMVQSSNPWLQSDWRNDGADANAFLHEGEDDAEMDAFMQQEENLRKQVDNHPLPKMAIDYMHRVQAWLKAADPDLKGLAQDWLEAAKVPDQDSDFEELARSVGDMIEVITWYHTFLYPKIGRALHSIFELRAGDRGILAKSDQYDANGSGKVVLIAVERSIAAWIFLREQLPKQEDAILSILVLLGRIRNGIHEEIPGAKTFLRPGFDIAG